MSTNSNSKNYKRPEMQTHPAYGMLSFSRASGSQNARKEPLFGSALAEHYGTIRLTIERGKWYHELHADHYFGTGEELIEVELTSAQFVEAITTLNTSPGVPCTIRHLNMERTPPPPPIGTEIERVRVKFEGDLNAMVATMKERSLEVEKLAGSKLSDKAKRQLRIELDVMIQQLASNVPFILQQFEESTARVVTAAKQEIEAFAQHRIQMAGAAALAGDDPPKQLALKQPLCSYVGRDLDHRLAHCALVDGHSGGHRGSTGDPI